jgi:hypothetical protein
MPKNVVITPASGLIDFKDDSGNVDAYIQLDDFGNLQIFNPGGDISLGDTASDIYVGDGITSVDIIFEQNGSVRALAGKTLTLGQSNSSIALASQITSNVTINGSVNISNTIASTSNLTGALTVAGGVGIAGNLSVTNATVNGQLGISAPNDSAARLKITATGSGAVFNQADNSNIFFQTQGVNRLTIADATGNGTLQGNLTVQGTSTSVSNTTGALTVAGGLGVSGNVYSGGVYDTGVNIIGFAGRAFNHANAAFTSANLINGIDTTQNNSITAAFLAANSAATLSAATDLTQNNSITAAFLAANSAATLSAATDLTQNNSITAAFLAANSAATLSAATDLTQNNSITAAFLAANSAATLSAATDLTQNNSITAAFTRANNSISANAGGTITGDLVVTGNLTISGQTTYANTINVQLGDNIITLNAELPVSVTPSENAGFEINRGNTLANASLLWIESAGKWQANSGSATGAYFIGSESAGIYANGAFAAANAAGTTNITQNNSITASFTQANLAVVNALAASNYANAAFLIANASLLIDTTQNNSITAAFAVANQSLLIDTTQNNSITAAFTAANNRVLKTGDTMTGNLVINATGSHGLIVTNTSTSGAIAFGGTNGRTLRALQGGSTSNFDFDASQVYYNGDLLVGGKLSSPNSTTANLFLTATYNGATIFTDRGVYVACTNAAISNSSGALILNGGAGIGGNFYNRGGSALYISANTFGDGGTNSGANALVYINQTNGWSGNQPWSLFVNGYSNLAGLRINGSDTPRALHKTTAGNLGFSLSDGTSVISFGPQNGTFAFTVAPPYNTGVSANNYIQVRPGNTGVNANGVFITVEGVDANSDINIVPKGINGKVNIYSTVASTSNTTGSLVLNGGLGITGNLFMSSANNFTGSGSGSSYRLGWTDNYFHRSNQFGGVQFTGTYLSLLTNTYVETGYNLVIRGQIYNDFGDLRVFFNAASGVNVANVQAATTNTSGSLIVYGGAGIRGNVYSGGIYLTGATSNGITFTDGTKQTSAGAGIADVLALSIALG